jgi:Zn-dependent protease with chaperone function
MPSDTIDVPAGPSLAGRLAAAIALTIGFYVLALALAGALIAAGILPWVFEGRNNLWLTIAGPFFGISILVAIVPRRTRFVAPGIKVTAEDQPRLLEIVGEEAARADEPVPAEIYLTFEPNASVMEPKRGRRVLVVGVGLLRILTERELRGVLAHEFGHYRGGDLKAGPWIYRTRTAIGRTIDNLSEHEVADESWSQRAIRKPFLWYGNAFLRITAAISRREEFAADACAVQSVGRAAHVSALQRLHAFGPGFDFYWQHEVVPVLQSGRRPSVSDGFRRFVEHEDVSKSADQHLEEIREKASDAYDSHPSLAERIAAVRGRPDGPADNTPPAIDLLRDPDAAERELFAYVLGDELREFEPVDWDAVGNEVYGRRAEALTEAYPQILDGVTLGSLPEAVAAIPTSARKLADEDIDDPNALVAHVLGDGALLALKHAGWTLTAEPAEPIGARRGDAVLAPHAVVDQLRTGELDAETWRERAQSLGVTDLELSRATTPAA